MNQEVYVVTSGCYSDYHINAIFSTREKAEEYAELLPDANSIEVYVLDGEHKNGLHTIIVVMDRDGNTSECYLDEYVFCLEKYKLKWGEFWYDSSRKFYVLAKDKQHAIKICNEKRAMLLAENKWEMDNLE